MKKTSLLLLLFCQILLFVSCGGVVGNIQKYSFSEIDSTELKSALRKVYLKYPELIKLDSTKYGSNNGDTFYFLLNSNKIRTVFVCHVITYPSPYESELDLSLTSAVIWGENMELATKMGFFEKRRYRQSFERNILPKIREAINLNKSL